MPQQPTSPSPLLEARFLNPMITTVKTSSVVQGMPKYRSMLAGNPAYIPSSYESIATATGTGSSGTITFSSIPGTFKHLQIRGIARNASAAVGSSSSIVRLNSDSANNYAYHLLYGNGSTVTASGAANTQAYIAEIARSGNTNAVLSGIIIDILDYASTSKNKTIRVFNGYDDNGAGFIGVSSGLWMSTSAITSISIVDSNNLTSTTTFALYGIKEA